MIPEIEEKDIFEYYRYERRIHCFSGLCTCYYYILVPCNGYDCYETFLNVEYWK